VSGARLISAGKCSEWPSLPVLSSMRCSKASAAEVDVPPFVHARSQCRPGGSGCLPSRPSQHSLQPGHLLLPTRLFGLRLFLKGLQRGSNACYFLFVLPTGCVQGALRPADGMLPPLALLLQGSFFLRVLARAAIVLLLESECGLPTGRLVVAPPRRLLCYGPAT
jgi:hypothetical protein